MHFFFSAKQGIFVFIDQFFFRSNLVFWQKNSSVDCYTFDELKFFSSDFSPIAVKLSSFVPVAVTFFSTFLWPHRLRLIFIRSHQSWRHCIDLQSLEIPKFGRGSLEIPNFGGIKTQFFHKQV